jgi:hypothetical protein
VNPVDLELPLMSLSLSFAPANLADTLWHLIAPWFEQNNEDRIYRPQRNLRRAIPVVDVFVILCYLATKVASPFQSHR